MTPQAERIMHSLVVGLAAVAMALIFHYLLASQSMLWRALGSGLGAGIGAWIALQVLSRS